MNDFYTIFYVINMAALAWSLCILLQKMFPFECWACFGSMIPRFLVMTFLVLVVAATIRHIVLWETKPEELLLATTLNFLFWWVVWFHRDRLKSLDSYF